MQTLQLPAKEASGRKHPSENHPLLEQLLKNLYDLADTCNQIKDKRREIDRRFHEDVAGQSYNVMLWLTNLESNLVPFPGLRCS